MSTELVYADVQVLRIVSFMVAACNENMIIVPVPSALHLSFPVEETAAYP